MKRKLLIGCLVPLAALVLGGWWGYRRYMAASPNPPRFETVDRGEVEIQVTETGTIEPLRKVEVKSKVAGRIAALYVTEGNRVAAGALLARIDPTEINSQVAQMRAQLDGARARLAQAMKGVAYQRKQTAEAIVQAEEGVRAAGARLKMARQESDAQPLYTSSDVAQAQATVRSATDSVELLKRSTHPQGKVQAQTGYDDARAALENATRQRDRQKRLLARGFASQQAVDATVADMAAAQARCDQARNRLDLLAQQQAIELETAQHRVDEANAALARARAGSSAVAIKRSAAAAAAAALRQATSQLQAARSGHQQDRMREDDVAQAKSAVVQIENQLREIQVRQGDTRLLAPMAGTITMRYVEEGELVTSGVSTFSSGTPVVQVADLSRMLVKMSVNEVDVHKIRRGLPVEVAIDGARGTLFQGHVRKVAPAAIAGQPGQGGNVVRFAVEVAVDDPDERLKPGMSARCTIVIARRRGVLRLPAHAVEGEGRDAHVMLMKETRKDGKPVVTFERHPVVAGLRGDAHIEIVSGLKVGDRAKPGQFTGPKRKAIDLNFK
ncbi:MAG: efflux RND transporter periplasmic adaptor subunit [Chthonomonadales bacterium]|nr:efflux RND transporter periplasmic adaptor subunit [Chthonomonadales bacterium]